MERVILHSDMNCFYASVEQMLNPSLKGIPMAVGGSTESRHGIVLTKSYEAKKYGVKTGMALWEARECCPDIVIVPPQYEQYMKYSKLARNIYKRYTDLIEPFGMDECWLDVTGSVGIHGSGEEIAEKIRATIREELGLTVSVGVSYNKIFAKLGSDMKKPDAVTVIKEDDFKEKVWKLPVEDLLFVGRATKLKLNSCAVLTIGDLANFPPHLLKAKLGKNGLMLHAYANGNDISPVMPLGFESQIKSIGHGITCVADLESNDEVFNVIQELTQNIGRKLRKHGLAARGVQLYIRDKNLMYQQWQTQMEHSSQCAMDIAECAKRLFKRSYRWYDYVRAVTVRAINLIPDNLPTQISLFDDDETRREKRKAIECTIDDIRRRFGYGSVTYATLMGNLKLPQHRDCEITMPSLLGR